MKRLTEEQIGSMVFEGFDEDVMHAYNEIWNEYERFRAQVRNEVDILLNWAAAMSANDHFKVHPDDIYGVMLRLKNRLNLEEK